MAEHEHNETIRQGATPPPAGLPMQPKEFWGGDEAMDALGACPVQDAPPALEKIGPPPFPRGGFPLMGFLASVYEHVATRAREAEGP